MAQGSDPALAEWVDRLASERYADRVEATGQLWAEGEAALDLLREAARSRDPEMALRARDLLRRIDLGITPDTDPEILTLTESYRTANLNRKKTIFNRLRSLKAWRQIMRLYANETDPSARDELARMVDGIAINAARERLVQGDAAGALELLELSGESESALMSIAAFHRAQGTLPEQLEQAANPGSPEEFRWLAALQRAAGNAGDAARSAQTAGDVATAAVLHMLDGDPLPWLEWKAAPDDRANGNTTPYARAAAMRLRGENIELELDAIRRMARSANHATRARGQAFLFLLGLPDAAWDSLEKQNPEEAFIHYDSIERVGDALEVLGIDPEHPDFGKYLGPLLERVCVAPGVQPELEDTRDEAVGKVITLCAFLEKRGAHSVLDQVVKPALLAFGETHPPRFTDLMSQLFATPGMNFGAPELASRIAIEWAGEDVQRWREMIIAAFGEDEGYTDWWELTATLDPQASLADRLRAILILFGYNRDPEHLYPRWIDLAWKKLGEDPQPQDSPVFASLVFLDANINDIELAERVARIQTDPDDEVAGFDNLLIDTAAGRWGDVADLFLQQIAAMAERGEARAEFHAYAAASLRRAGREDEVAAHESWADVLALGDMRSNLAIGQAYAFGRDYERAALWYRRALMEATPDDIRFTQALHSYLTELLEMRDNPLIASCSEVMAQLQAAEVADSGSGGVPSGLMLLRQQADFGRALALPVDQSDEARRILRAAHVISPTGGALADHFFPALATSRFTDLHEELFEISWASFTKSLALFPHADNSMNTAVWFASRGLRRLDESQKIQERALELNPRNPAYLDTLAEVYFALGDRAEAVRFGALAVRYMPGDSMIIRQFERFQYGEMPRR